MIVVRTCLFLLSKSILGSCAIQPHPKYNPIPHNITFSCVFHTLSFNCYQVLQNGTPSYLEHNDYTHASTMEEANHATDGVQAG